MGITLIPIRPTKTAPRNAAGTLIVAKYTWDEWADLKRMLKSMGVDTATLAETNDGNRLSAAKCREIADAIEADWKAKSRPTQEYLEEELMIWRNCGGFKQC